MKDVALLVLSSLADAPKHGYAIQQDVEAFAGVRLGPGALYGAISRLEDEDFIRALRSSRRRKPYEITPAGRIELDRKLTALRMIVRSAERRLKPA